MKSVWRFFLWAGLVVFAAACSAAPPATAARQSVVCGATTVKGSSDFITQTCAALALLQRKAPDAYQKVQTYIGVIEQGERSGVWAWEVPPRYEVSDKTAFASLTWYASTIAHDATHAQLYAEYQNAHPGGPTPEEVYNSESVERFCNAYQLETLRRIGAPQNEIEYLGALDGSHCDLDNDGDCDMADYQMRNW